MMQNGVGSHLDTCSGLVISSNLSARMYLFGEGTHTQNKLFWGGGAHSTHPRTHPDTNILKLLMAEAFSYYCMRPSATSG